MRGNEVSGESFEACLGGDKEEKGQDDQPPVRNHGDDSRHEAIGNPVGVVVDPIILTGTHIGAIKNRVAVGINVRSTGTTIVAIEHRIAVGINIRSAGTKVVAIQHRIAVRINVGRAGAEIVAVGYAVAIGVRVGHSASADARLGLFGVEGAAVRTVADAVGVVVRIRGVGLARVSEGV